MTSLTQGMNQRWSRRRLLRAGAGVAMLPAFGGLLAACSEDEDGAEATTAAGGGAEGETIKVGILHSFSGTMAVSEVSVADAEKMAIAEINAAGGVLGKQLETIIEDGASDWPTFAEKATKLIQSDGVVVTFGCWTSASRKAVLPVFEGEKALLFYPVQYEGLESSPYIYYMGATTNQQIVPSIEYLLEEGKTKFFLLGSDYVFPRTANTIIKAQLAAAGAETVAEEYTPLGHTEYSTVISKIQAAAPDVVYNTLNGDSNVAFFKQLQAAGITAPPGDEHRCVAHDHRHRPHDAVGLGRRGRGPRHRRGRDGWAPHRLELLPDGGHARERDLRRRLQGDVRRGARHG